MKLELIDLVNENDEVIGVIDRNDKEFINKKNVRGIALFLITKDNKIVVPKRSSNRRLFPNYFDFSVAGMVDSKEDYKTAIYRETKEELLLDNIELKEFAYFNPYKENVPIFLKEYVGFIKNEISNYDKDGIANISYLSFEELNNLLKESPQLFKPCYKLSLNALENYLKNNGIL